MQIHQGQKDTLLRKKTVEYWRIKKKELQIYSLYLISEGKKADGGKEGNGLFLTLKLVTFLFSQRKKNW